MEKNNAKEVDSKHIIDQPVHLDNAIEMVGFGSFHYYLLFICGSLFAAVAISVTSVSFILPSAQCDFKMTSVHKGLLNGASMIGMFTGSFIWGYLSDSKGRRYALILSMMMDGIFSFISSVSQIYPVLIFCRLMSGFGVSGATILYSYLGEFVNNKYREKCLCWMEIFWTAGIIILPCVAWVIIPQTFIIENEFFLFKSWNLFTIVCSIPSITLACLLMRLPESPKFLLTKGKHNETIECLKFVYRWNNKSDDKFPVKSVTLLDYVNGLEASNEQNKLLDNSNREILYSSSKGFLSGLYDSTVGLFTSQYKFIAIITCIIQFCATTSYYMLMLWFPELMNRFRWYEMLYTGPRDKGTMCEIVSLYTNEPEQTDTKCNDYIDDSVYVNIIIIGIACIPTSLIVPLFVNKLGLRFFLVVSFVGSGLSAAGLYFITSSTENLVLSSIFEALSSVGISLMYCIAVELFPTEYRGMAVSIGSTFGKVGALIGNNVVGVFIDTNCIVPIFVSCSFLIISALLVLTLPKTGGTDLK